MTAPPPRGRVRRWIAGLRWYLREVTGESRYDAYLRRHGAGTDGSAAMTEREFWREHARRSEGAPPTRCC